MGQRLYNANLVCDYATPDSYTAFELHMERPIPYSDFSKVQAWLAQGNWHAARQYLIQQYPQHHDILTQWCHASQQRQQSNKPQLQAVGA